MRRFKVFFFIPSFSGGGAERQCIYLVNALSKRKDMQVALVHFHEGVNYHLIDSSSVTCFQLETGSNYDPRNAWQASRLFAREKPDIVFSWLHASDVFTWAARLLHRDFKWVMAERDSWYPPDFRYWIRSMVGRHADMIVSNSEKGSLYWSERGVPSVRRRVVGNVLPDAWFLPKANQPDRALVCYAGRVEAQKNVLKLADSFVALSGRRQDVSFVMVGQGSLRDEVEVRLDGMNRDVISMLSFQPDIRPLFERTSVFVNLSYHEGKPNTVIENLALGNRVVLSRIPEHVELVGDDYPYLVDPDAPAQEVAALIERALGASVSDDERKLFHARLQHMRTDSIANEYVALFQSLLEA